MYIQIENLRGMTAEITEFCNIHALYSIEDLAKTTDSELLRNGEKYGVDQSMLLKMARQSREILRMDELILDHLVEGHLVFVETPQDIDGSYPEWRFRVVEEAQAPYGRATKIAELNPVKV